MAINSCTINSTTINAFCGVRRGIVLAGLIEQKNHKRPGAGTSTPRWIHPREEQPRILPTELERISVYADFMGLHGTDGQDVRPDMSLVTVTDIEIEPTTVSVNITGFRSTGTH
jgi:hypothetical protein